ncbi:MAG: FAD binding domain-containing protein [Acidimicrobiia bacterium]|nr:FAD binding domain-containing protein [Acidimicrobiia bacterium]
MYPREFEYAAPSTLDEALALLHSNEMAKVMSGGMSLIPLMKLRLFSPELVVDIGRVPGLDQIEDRGDDIAIGALVRHAEVAHSPLIREHAAALASAAAWTGDRQVRNRGTTCGALAHADVAADQPAAALALGATLVATSTSGTREIASEDFFVDALTSALEPTEILTELRIPKKGPGSGSAYDKLGRRGGHTDYAVAGVAARVTQSSGTISDARIAVTGVGTKPSLAIGAMEALVGSDGSTEAIAAAAARATEGVTVIEDLYGSEEYKAHLASVYTRRAVEQALAAAG